MDFNFERHINPKDAMNIGDANARMLDAIRAERPDQIIHKVIDFKKNDYGFYNVKVDMENNFFNYFVMHVHAILPYPIEDYRKLSEHEQTNWRLNNAI